MTERKDEERDAKILAYVAQRKYSYDVIAEMFSPPLTRGIVAGVVFRDRHPSAVRVKSLGSRGKNMVGHGYQPRLYYPQMTRNNTR